MSDSVDEQTKANSLDDTANEHAAAFNRHSESVSEGVCTVNRLTNSSLPVWTSTSD